MCFMYVVNSVITVINFSSILKLAGFNIFSGNTLFTYIHSLNTKFLQCYVVTCVHVHTYIKTED